MKHLSIILPVTLIALCTGLSLSLVGVPRTAVVAVREGYNRKILKLRNKAHKFLRDERIRMRLDVKEMRKEDLELRADDLTDQYKDAYFTVEENVDEAFEKISMEFIRGADELDEDEASVKEKTAFIDKMEDKAERKINELLKRNKEIMQNNPLNVDI